MTGGSKMKCRGFLCFGLLFVVAGFILLLAAPCQSADMSAYEIVKKSEDLLNQANDSKADMLMTLVNKKGKKRERKLSTYIKEGENDSSKSLLFFQSPADVKGTSFLVWSEPDKDDQQWLYLPALQRVRQISASGKGESFMGTEFTFFDMGSHDIDDYTYTLVKEADYDGQPCYVIEALPKKVQFYNKVIVWIRKDNFIPAMADFYNTKDQYLKQGIFSDIKNIQGIDTPTHIEMHNRQNKRSTILELNNIVYDTGLKDDIFTQRYMKRGR
jgi:outer membrane lipoprotein-sorting protein